MSEIQVANRDMLAYHSVMENITVSRHVELFGKFGVQAESVEDFAAKYRKFDRYGARDEEYRNCVLGAHRDELARFGITWISHHDSTTGETVSWMPGV